jgi:hypothetical protein
MGKFGIAKKGLGLLGKRIKRPGMSKEDKIKTGAVAATGAAITGLGVLKAKSDSRPRLRESNQNKRKRIKNNG